MDNTLALMDVSQWFQDLKIILAAADISDWEKIGIGAGVATSILFLAVLIFQIVATLATHKAANAAKNAAGSAQESAQEAKRSNDLAALEINSRLRPSVGITELHIRKLDDEISAEGGTPSIDLISFDYKNHGLQLADKVDIKIQKSLVYSGEETIMEVEQYAQGAMFPSEVSVFTLRYIYEPQRQTAYVIKITGTISYRLGERRWETHFGAEIEIRAEESEPVISWRNVEAN